MKYLMSFCLGVFFCFLGFVVWAYVIQAEPRLNKEIQERLPGVSIVDSSSDGELQHRIDEASKQASLRTKENIKQRGLETVVNEMEVLEKKISIQEFLHNSNLALPRSSQGITMDKVILSGATICYNLRFNNPVSDDVRLSFLKNIPFYKKQMKPSIDKIIMSISEEIQAIKYIYRDNEGNVLSVVIFNR